MFGLEHLMNCLFSYHAAEQSPHFDASARQTKSSNQCATLLAHRLFGIQGFMTILSNKFETIRMFTEGTVVIRATSSLFSWDQLRRLFRA